MIVVDSSVWIAHLRNVDLPAVRFLRSFPDSSAFLVGDLVMLEVLQGARDEVDARRIEQLLRQFNVESMLDESIAVEAASNYRDLRRRGVTIRKTNDMIIATFCLRHGYALLHDDRDFERIALHFGLKAF